MSGRYGSFWALALLVELGQYLGFVNRRRFLEFGFGSVGVSRWSMESLGVGFDSVGISR